MQCHRALLRSEDRDILQERRLDLLEDLFGHVRIIDIKRELGPRSNGFRRDRVEVPHGNPANAPAPRRRKEANATVTSIAARNPLQSASVSSPSLQPSRPPPVLASELES